MLIFNRATALVMGILELTVSAVPSRLIKTEQVKIRSTKL